MSLPAPDQGERAATVPITPAAERGDGGRRPSGPGWVWVGDSIGYIYVYLRGRLDAEDRRRRLTEERAGAEAMLSGAYNELALSVLREGIAIAT